MVRWWALNLKDKNRMSWSVYSLVGTSIWSRLKSPSRVNLISLYSSIKDFNSLFYFNNFLFSADSFSHFSQSFFAWLFLYFWADLLITLLSVSLKFLFRLMIGVLWISFKVWIYFSLPCYYPIVFYVFDLYSSNYFYFSFMVLLALKSILLRFFSFSVDSLSLSLSFFKLVSTFLSFEFRDKFSFLRLIIFCSRLFGPCSFLN